MSDENKKKNKEYVIAGAISIAAGYFVGYVQLNKLFSLPFYVYATLSIFVGILFFAFLFSYARFLMVSYRDSKQEEYVKMPNLKSDEMFDIYHSEWERYFGLEWLIETERFDGHMNSTSGPFCPKDRTRMTSRKTLFGRYEYECSTCLLKVRKDYNRDTLENRLNRIVEAKLYGWENEEIVEDNKIEQRESQRVSRRASKNLLNALKNIWSTFKDVLKML